MNHVFAIEKLTEFLTLVNAHIADHDLATRDKSVDLPEWPQELVLLEVEARQIINAYVPGLGDVDDKEYGYWRRVRAAAAEALGRARSAEAIADFLRPTSPAIAADSLHPWVWESAAPLWAAEARQDAVLAAARTVNARLQQKLSRHDIGETALCFQTFEMKDPVAGVPRLRFPGDRNTKTWRARQDGAKFLAAGVFLAIRNVAAHEDMVSWSAHEALEHLATLSVLARWIEECTVEAVA